MENNFSLFDEGYWRDASLDEALLALQRIENEGLFSAWNDYLSDKEDFRDFIMHYFWIFREETVFRNIINHKDFPADLALQFIYFGFGRFVTGGREDFDAFFTDVRKMLKSEQCFRILTLTDQINRDPTLRIHLLANLDSRSWDDFFLRIGESDDSIQNLIHIFENIRIRELNQLLLQNPMLYNYLRILIELDEGENTPERIEKKKEILSLLDEIHKWEVFSKDMRNTFNLEEESLLAPNIRNPNRISCLLHEGVKIANNDHRNDVFIYLKVNGVILDDWEFDVLKHASANYSEYGSYF